jgi:hypothetical protein
LVNKYIQFNDHTSSGPDENFGYVASGASDDWFYATLGAAGVTFELGNAFRQNCNYFEDSILPGNLKALTYAAKVSSKPYSLPKGPDIVSMIVLQEQVVNLPGAFVTVALDVSDNLLASSQALDSTQQTVTAVRIYVDRHPYDNSGNAGPLVTLTGSQLKVVASSERSPTTLGMATIVLDQLLDTRPGRHAIYVEAVDSGGTVGPVTTAWFEILPPPPTQAPTPVPTKSPTAKPTGKPTIDRIGLVIQIRLAVYRRLLFDRLLLRISIQLLLRSCCPQIFLRLSHPRCHLICQLLLRLCCHQIFLRLSHPRRHLICQQLLRLCCRQIFLRMSHPRRHLICQLLLRLCCRQIFLRMARPPRHRICQRQKIQIVLKSMVRFVMEVSIFHIMIICILRCTTLSTHTSGSFLSFLSAVSFNSSTFDEDNSSCHISTNHMPLMLLLSAALVMVLF